MIRTRRELSELGRKGATFQEQWNAILNSQLLKNMSFYEILYMLSLGSEDVDIKTDTDYSGIAADFSSPAWLALDPKTQGEYAAQFQRWYRSITDFEEPDIGIKFELIPPGLYWQGSPEDEPERSSDEKQRLVLISEPFWCGKYTVTQEEWRKVMGTDPSHFKGDRLPVECVSWDDCNEFCEKSDVNFLTEAQWEYACRAGTTSAFSFGHTITTDQVNFDGNYPYNNGPKGISRGKTVEVGSLPGNPFGLYEMHGNVWEWCQDWYSDRYEDDDEEESDE